MLSSFPIALTAVLGGIFLLVRSADHLVEASTVVADKLGIDPFLIGIFIIGFGTSSPEILVSAVASWQGFSGIVFGNAYGSNTMNIAIVLGLVASFVRVTIPASAPATVVWLWIATALSWALIADGRLTGWDALFLLLLFAWYLFWQLRNAKRHANELETSSKTETRISLARALLWTFVSLAVLLLSSSLLVWGGENLARHLGVSELIIGLSVLAVGTSLPELVSSIAAIRRQHGELVLGTVVGSNVLNTLAAVGIAGALNTLSVSAEVLSRDLLAVSLVTLVLGWAVFTGRKKGFIEKRYGRVLLVMYVLYLLWVLRTL